MFDARVFTCGLIAALLSTLGCDTFAIEPERTACDVPSDCTLVDNDCCGKCGLGLADVTAINVRSAADHRAEQCGDGLTCNGIACTHGAPTLIATCQARRCTAIELPKHPAAVCNTDADCHVRALACCECGASIEPDQLVAISDPVAFERLVCAPDLGCPECEASHPDAVTASCVSGGCRVQDRRNPFRN